jgi:hypothetical protein
MLQCHTACKFGFAFRVLQIALDFLSFRLISWVIPASYRTVQTSSGTGGR